MTSFSMKDVELIAQAPLVTGRYQSWRPGDGVPIRSTVGEPRFWNPRVPLSFAQALAPYGVFGREDLSDDEGRALYRRRRLDQYDWRVVADLAKIAEQHPGQRLVVLCFEDVHAGEVCHRRWFAEWFEERFKIAVPELPARPSQPAARAGDVQLHLFGMGP